MGLTWQDTTASRCQGGTGKNRSDMRAKGLPLEEPIAPMPVFPARKAFEPQPVRNEIPEKLTEEERMVFAMNRRCCS